MGFFGKLFGALKKAKEGMGEKLRVLFSKNKLGDEFYEELEEILISSDVSVKAAMEVVERVKEQAIKDKLTDPEYAVSLLREVLTDMLEEAEVEELYLSVGYQLKCYFRMRQCYFFNICANRCGFGNISL